MEDSQSLRKLIRNIDDTNACMCAMEIANIGIHEPFEMKIATNRDNNVFCPDHEVVATLEVMYNKEVFYMQHVANIHYDYNGRTRTRLRNHGDLFEINSEIVKTLLTRYNLAKFVDALVDYPFHKYPLFPDPTLPLVKPASKTQTLLELVNGVELDEKHDIKNSCESEYPLLKNIYEIGLQRSTVTLKDGRVLGLFEFLEYLPKLKQERLAEEKLKRELNREKLDYVRRWSPQQLDRW